MRTFVYYMDQSIEKELDLNAPHDEYLPNNRTITSFIHDTFHRGFNIDIRHAKHGDEDVQLLIIDRSDYFKIIKKENT